MITYTSIGGMCPTQADGEAFGHPFYFRARHGSWTFDIVKPGCDPVWPEKDEDLVWSTSGDDETNGCMAPEVVRVLIETQVDTWQQHVAGTASHDGYGPRGDLQGPSAEIVSVEEVRPPRFRKPKARPNRFLSRNARKAHQRRVQRYQRTKAMERQLCRAVADHFKAVMVRPSFFDVIFPATGPDAQPRKDTP